MTPNRFCDDGGWLADGNTRLPTDKCEYYSMAAQPLQGCNKLRCSRCQAWIRSGPPGLGLRADTMAEPATLHAAENWRELPFVGEMRNVRLHTCACTMWLAKVSGSIENDHEDPSDPNVPWVCTGHPAPELPVTLGELTIGVESDWSELVGKILGGICPRPLDLGAQALREGPSSWLGWLYVYLAGLPAAEQMSAALADRAQDPDPLVVGRVLHFFSAFPRAAGVERLVALAEAAVERVAIGYPAPEHYRAPTLWDVLIARLEHRSNPPDPLDRKVGELVRKIMLVPLSSLAHDDLGPTDFVAVVRAERIHQGWDIDSEWSKQMLKEYADGIQRERTDVVVNALDRYSTAFSDDDLRLWITEKIVAVNDAAKGRWRPLMNLLTDWYHKPDLGYLIVIAGARLIESSTVKGSEFREWIISRRAHGWVDPAWVLPLQSMLEKQGDLH